MIVCHCIVVNDRRIRALISDTTSVEDITRLCGAGRDCGGCVDTIEALLEHHRETPARITASV